MQLYTVDCPSCNHRFVAEEKTHHTTNRITGQSEISTVTVKEEQYCRACNTNFQIFYDRKEDEITNKKEKK